MFPAVHVLHLRTILEDINMSHSKLRFFVFKQEEQLIIEKVGPWSIFRGVLKPR